MSDVSHDQRLTGDRGVHSTATIRMQSRRSLVILLSALSVLSVAAVTWALVQSMNPTERERNKVATLVDIGTIAPGELKVVEVQPYGRKLFLFRPTAEVFEDLGRLNPHVWNPRVTSYDKEHGLFIYWGQSTKYWEDLTHMPKGKSAFGQSIEGGHIWLGGYYDRGHDPSYDYAGRTIKSYEYTFNGYREEHPNLWVPQYQFENQHVLLIRRP